MKFIAHQGYSAKWQGNTMPAFKAVFEDRAFADNDVVGIELDIQLTTDREIAVFHDVSVERDGLKIPVAEIDHQTLVSIVRNRKPGGSFTSIPVLSEVLDFISHRIALFVEIKGGNYDIGYLVSALKKILTEYQPRKDIIIHSFSMEIMTAALKELSCLDVEFGFLCSQRKELTEAGDDFIGKMDYLHPYMEFLLEEERLFLDYGKTLNNVWTVNDIGTLKKLENSRCRNLIKAVTTDNLVLIQEWKNS